MTSRATVRLSVVALALLIGLNTLSGAAKIGFDMLRNDGENALAAARLGLAYERFRTAAFLQPGESTGHVLMARSVRLALANGLPLDALPGEAPDRMLGRARQSLARAIDRNPGDAWAWFTLAELYRGHRAGQLRLERLRSAPERARRALAGETVSEPDGPRPEDPIIVAATMKAVDLDPEYYFYRDFLALLYWTAGLQEVAAREVERAFALLPDPGSHVLINRDGIPGPLVEAALAGIARAESHPLIDPRAVVLARAEFLLDQGRLDESIAALERVRDSGALEGLLELDLRIGQLHQRAGHDEKALSFLEGVLAADPEGDLGTRALYSLGDSYRRLGRLDRAVEAFREHLVRRPQFSRSYLALANAYRLRGSTDEAESLYRNALQRFPSDSRVHLRWIRFLEDNERWFDAIRAAEDAVSATRSPDTRQALERLRARAVNAETEAIGGD